MLLKYGVQQAPQTSIVYWCYKKELFGNYQIQILDIQITHPHHLIRYFLRSNCLKFRTFKMRISNFIYNCLNKTSPVNFQLWLRLTIQVHNHNTRSQYINIDKSIYNNNLFIPPARTSNYNLLK